jgi:hypothetical protein
MKYVIAAGLIALAGLNALLLFKQSQLATRVTTLDTQNAELTRELTARTPLSADAVIEAEHRLARAQESLAQVEQRLTNATTLLNSMQAPGSRIGAATPTANAITTTRVPAVGNTVEPASSAPFIGPELVPSSSHTPDGKVQSRSWGPEQVLGPPDTHSAGDIPSAWAPLSSQGGANEWLHVNYDRAVDISEIHVRETHNPGAIAKLAAVLPDGREVVLWEGAEPKAEAPVDMTFSVPNGVSAQSVKIYLDRTRVPGWNEIDAVELVGRDGSRQWASSATASSSYAEPTRLATSLPAARQ